LLLFASLRDSVNDAHQHLKAFISDIGLESYCIKR
uniref:Uncharacterized protein n=1 Tax=Amphimedon queenslandica TaxID=400682 RepID=A0A1X7SGE3_AMPQE